MRSSVLVLGLALLPACGGSGSTSLASGAGGASSGTNGAGGASSGTNGAGGATASSSSVMCSYPPANNPPGCPPSYSSSYNGQPCSAPGLECWYPGAGDVDATGCNATALLECTTQFTDAGDPEWRAAM